MGLSLAVIKKISKMSIPEAYIKALESGKLDELNNGTFALAFNKKKIRLTDMKELKAIHSGGPWDYDSFLRADGDEETPLIYFPLALFNINRDKFGEGDGSIDCIALDTTKDELPVVRIEADHDSYDVYEVTDSFETFLSAVSPEGADDPFRPICNKIRWIEKRIENEENDEILEEVLELTDSLKKLPKIECEDYRELIRKLAFFRAKLRFLKREESSEEELTEVIFEAMEILRPIRSKPAYYGRLNNMILEERFPFAEYLIDNGKASNAVELLEKVDIYKGSPRYIKLLERAKELAKS